MFREATLRPPSAALSRILGGMDQGFRGNATYIKAGSADLIRLHKDCVDAKLSRANGADVAPWPRTNNKKLAGNSGHDYQLDEDLGRSLEQGFSLCTKIAASQPSMTR